MIFLLISVSCAGVLLIYALYCQYRPSVTWLNKVPGPKAWPVLGHALDIIVPPERIFELLREWTIQYGDIVHLWALHIRTVMVNNPSDAEKILSNSKYNDKGTPYNYIRPWLSEGILISNGQKWQQRRKMLTPTFHFDILKQFFSSFVQQTNTLLTNLELEVGKEQTDLVHPMKLTTLNVMCQTAMGITDQNGVKTKIKDYLESIHIFGECLVYRLTRMWQHFEWVYFFTLNKLKRDSAVKKLHNFTEQVIDKRKTLRKIYDFIEIITPVNKNNTEYGDKRMAMLDLLLEHESKGSVDRLGVREEVDSFMFAGHDTTSIALSFFFLQIAIEQETQGRIYEELNHIYGDSDRDPTIDDLKAMTYLECCIKESLRLYPSVPLIVRHLKEDVELSGYKIPRGTVCSINIYDIHRRKDIYPEPEKFIPERFLPENTNNRHKYAFIPFSAGPRNCIGQRFAMMMMKTVISGVLRRFLLKPVTRLEDLKFTADLVLRTNKPFYVQIERRVEKVKNMV